MAKQLEDLIGSKLVIGVPGTTVTPEIVQHFKDTRAGGIIFYRINFVSPPQIKKFITDLESALGRKLLVCVDHEGGRVIMYRDGITVFPDNLTFGHAGDPTYAQQAGEIAAKELRALGTDINFAPVLDVLTESYSPNIGIRSYGMDFKKVSEMGIAYVKGLQSGGVSATIKHFPGKGHAPVDAHLKLPTIKSTWEEMRAVHLQPFVDAIQAGVDCVMTSHPYYPKLDPDPQNIATFSRRIVYECLRDELKFTGLIVSDDLEMGAVKDVCPIDVAAVRTVKAGHDLVLACHDLPSQKKVFQGLLEAYKSKLLPMKELEESVDRIEKLKGKRKERFSGTVGPIKEGPILARTVCDKAVQVLQNPKNMIPLSAELSKDVAVIFPQLSSFAQKIMVEKEFEDEIAYFDHLLADYPGLHVTEIYPINPDDESIESAVTLSRKSMVTLFFCFDAHLHPVEQKLMAALQGAAKNLIVILMRDPYDKSFLRPKDAGLTCFGWRKCQIEAVVRKIYGEA